MPSMANITVKDSDGTTDVVFTVLNPAGTDGSPARWRVEDAALNLAHRQTLECISRWNANRTARKVLVVYRRPLLRDTGVAGVKELMGYVEMRNGEFTVPQDIVQSTASSAAAIGGNVMAHALIKSSVVVGYAPN